MAFVYDDVIKPKAEKKYKKIILWKPNIFKRGNNNISSSTSSKAANFSRMSDKQVTPVWLEFSNHMVEFWNLLSFEVVLVSNLTRSSPSFTITWWLWKSRGIFGGDLRCPWGMLHWFTEETDWGQFTGWFRAIRNYFKGFLFFFCIKSPHMIKKFWMAIWPSNNYNNLNLFWITIKWIMTQKKISPSFLSSILLNILMPYGQKILILTPCYSSLLLAPLPDYYH